MPDFFDVPELWETLTRTDSAVVLWGMGNGADKILSVCEAKGIRVRDVFASDGFVRGQVFHGMKVLSWGEIKAKYGAENVVVLLSFGSSRPDVLENIARIASETNFYAPDVPAFGDGLFDRRFALSHREELLAARNLLSDAESRRIFDLTVSYKLSGEVRYLFDAVNDREEVLSTLVKPENIRLPLDLGAYTGDTVRELLDADAAPGKVFAFEPDPRTFKKLVTYAETETRTTVKPIRAAAWNCEETLFFDASGNRNASAGQNRSSSLAVGAKKLTETLALPPDSILRGEAIDYIKFDVEGAEKEAIEGCSQTILRFYPALLVSLYHRNEDLFALPLSIRKRFPDYRGYYLRRFAGIPAWDLNLYVRKENDG